MSKLYSMNFKRVQYCMEYHRSMFIIVDDVEYGACHDHMSHDPCHSMDTTCDMDWVKLQQYKQEACVYAWENINDTRTEFYWATHSSHRSLNIKHRTLIILPPSIHFPVFGASKLNYCSFMFCIYHKTTLWLKCLKLSIIYIVVTV